LSYEPIPNAKILIFDVFFADFKAALRDILGEVGQKATLKSAEKDTKSEFFALRD
jgi:hypothetical protein